MAESVTIPKRKHGWKHVLVGVTGSVATIKIGELVTKIRACGNCEVAIVATKAAAHFMSKSDIRIPEDTPIFSDEDEWALWQKRGDPVLHIELRRWADIFLVAPLDANTLAKMANGICDNLLTCVARAWDVQKPLLCASAMNTFMYEHPLTKSQVDFLMGLGYKVIPAVDKQLICGDKGIGAMASVDTIVSSTLKAVEHLN